MNHEPAFHISFRRPKKAVNAVMQSIRHFHGHLEVDSDARMMEIYCGGTEKRFSRCGDRVIKIRNQYCATVQVEETKTCCMGQMPHRKPRANDAMFWGLKS